MVSSQYEFPHLGGVIVSNSWPRGRAFILSKFKSRKVTEREELVPGRSLDPLVVAHPYI
jgi:hypothetical protein